MSRRRRSSLLGEMLKLAAKSGDQDILTQYMELLKRQQTLMFIVIIWLILFMFICMPCALFGSITGLF